MVKDKTPKTIEDILLKPYLWRHDDWVKVKSDLSALFDYVIGENEFVETSYNEYIIEDKEQFHRNILRQEQRERKNQLFKGGSDNDLS